MERAKSIEALSVFFTLGVMAGTVVPAGASIWLSAILLPLLCVPVLFRDRLRLLAEAPALTAIIASFLLLGLFCAVNARQGSISSVSALGAATSSAAHGLRAVIDSVPFGADVTSPLLKAFLTGDRSELPRELVAVFRSSGASHLLALSGLHIGILYLIFDKLTWPFGRTRAALWIRYVSIAAAGGFFTLMTGASPSIVRAYLFIFIRETLRMTGKPQKATRVLCLALLVQLVIDPSAIKSVGFQLSYLAMAGIFILNPFLSGLYPSAGRWDPFRRIWNAVSLTVSCQAFTAPLSWHYFHTFPRHFLLTNLMAIPLTTLLVGTAVVTVVLSAFGICPAFMIATTDGLCSLLVWVLEVISGL